jgi:hypothetical protein
MHNTNYVIYKSINNQTLKCVKYAWAVTLYIQLLQVFRSGFWNDEIIVS